MAHSRWLADKEPVRIGPRAHSTIPRLFRYVPASLVRCLQVDYLLGKNPQHMSYVVGFARRYPQQLHHRGASIVSIRQDSSFVSCWWGWTWFASSAANPNVHYGALVGGPADGVSFQFSQSFLEGGVYNQLTELLEELSVVAHQPCKPWTSGLLSQPW